MNTNEHLETCLSAFTKPSPQQYPTNTSDQSHCPAIWDGFNCWEPTASGESTYQSCPALKGSDSSNMAFRRCGLTGKWLDKNGIPSDLGWTNYTPCFTPEIREIMRRLGSEDESQVKLNIALNTRILEFVGLSLSLASLLISLLIFFKFRSLRNNRTRIHRHLFIAMLLQVAIRLTLYIDQAITRNPNAMLTSEGSSPRPPTNQESLRGIDNTPVICEMAYVLLEYARTCMFFWMFDEGLYLHNTVTVMVFEEKVSPKIYFLIGWVAPIPLTFAWTIATWLHYGSSTNLCWWGYSFTIYFWILEGPRFAVMLVNMAFLLNILRILVLKLRRFSSSEAQNSRKAVKAALLLLPLLGLTNIVNMIHSPLEKSAWVFGAWSYSTHLLASSQGLILSFTYCFFNGEVQTAVKKYFQVKLLQRNKLRLNHSSVRRSLLNHTVIAQVPCQIEGRGYNCPSTTGRANPRPEIRVVQLSFNLNLNCNNSMRRDEDLNNDNDNVNPQDDSHSPDSSSNSGRGKSRRLSSLGNSIDEISGDRMNHSPNMEQNMEDELNFVNLNKESFAKIDVEVENLIIPVRPSSTCT